MAKTPTIVAAGAPEDVSTITYRARTPDGKIVTGTAQATSAADVTRELISRGLTPLKIAGGAGSALNAEFKFRKSAKRSDMVIVTRQLAAMMAARLPTVQALEIVSEDCEDPLLAGALNEVRLAQIRGTGLAAAFADQGPVFPRILVDLLAAGEEHGRAADAMERIATQLDAEDRLRSKVRKALTYPIAMAVVMALVFTFMTVYLVPQFAQIFTDIGGPDAELPALTRMVVGLSDVLVWVLLAGAVVSLPALAWYRAVKDRESFRAVVDPLKLKIPVFGPLMHKVALARFARTLSGLLGGGVEKLHALTVAANACGNVHMERAILVARDGHRAGRPLTEPLRDEPLFPRKVVTFIETGEKSSTTPQMLAEIAGLYDREVEVITDMMSELIQPIFVTALAVIAGVLAMACFMPYIDMINLAAGP